MSVQTVAYGVRHDGGRGGPYALKNLPQTGSDGSGQSLASSQTRVHRISTGSSATTNDQLQEAQLPPPFVVRSG